jgi:hypothetical protein
LPRLIAASSGCYPSPSRGFGDGDRDATEPSLMIRTQHVIASVQIADLLLRSEKIGCSGNHLPVTHEQCLSASGWSVLFPNAQEAEQAIARASLHRSLERLPSVLEGLV